MTSPYEPYAFGPEADESKPIEVTPEMIEAGVSILWELEGEVSKEVLAREVFQAMATAGAGTQKKPRRREPAGRV